MIWQDRGTRDDDGWKLDHGHVVVTDECSRPLGAVSAAQRLSAVDGARGADY
jgi:hypothetical protein